MNFAMALEQQTLITQKCGGKKVWCHYFALGDVQIVLQYFKLFNHRVEDGLMGCSVMILATPWRV